MQFHVCHCSGPFESLIVYRTLIGHVMCLKGLIAAVFGSSEPLSWLRLNGRVGAIPTESLPMFSLIYVERQGMRACNNNNMCNPSLHLFFVVAFWYKNQGK